MTSFKFIPALVCAAMASSLKVGVISDPHYNPYFDPTVSDDDNCTDTSNSSDFGPIGRYGCDMGPDMFDLMLTRFKDAFGDIDFLLVPGDHVAHKVSSKTDDPDGTAYAEMKEYMQATWTKISEAFPGKVILPTIGNNDGRFHDQAIDESDRSDYYSFLYDLWFSGFSGNHSLDLASIKSTFL